MGTRAALIVIGRYKDEWNKLSPEQQNDFIALVGKSANAAGIEPVTGYRLASTPGAFLEIWEASSRQVVERAVSTLKAMGYTDYVEARWLIGEREDDAQQ